MAQPDAVPLEVAQGHEAEGVHAPHAVPLEVDEARRLRKNALRRESRFRRKVAQLAAVRDYWASYPYPQPSARAGLAGVAIAAPEVAVEPGEPAGATGSTAASPAVASAAGSPGLSATDRAAEHLYALITSLGLGEDQPAELM